MIEEMREAFVILILNERDRIRNTRGLSVEEREENVQKYSNDMCTRVCGYKSIGRKKRGSVW